MLAEVKTETLGIVIYPQTYRRVSYYQKDEAAEKGKRNARHNCNRLYQ